MDHPHASPNERTPGSTLLLLLAQPAAHNEKMVAEAPKERREIFMMQVCCTQLGTRNFLRAIHTYLHRHTPGTGLFGQQLLGDDHALHLTGTLADLADLRVTQVPLHREFTRVAVAPVNL